MKEFEFKKVGVYVPKFNELCDINLPCIDILQSQGLHIHILKKHVECMKFIPLIPEIIEKPDYIGAHPNITNSIELIKLYDEYILLSIGLNATQNYLYVSSLYSISKYKLDSRINSGRIKIYT